MLKIQTIMRLVPKRKKPLFGPEQIAPAELQAARLAVCEGCKYNQGGICRQCCAGVPLPTLVHLTASRCARNFWHS